MQHEVDILSNEELAKVRKMLLSGKENPVENVPAFLASDEPSTSGAVSPKALDVKCCLGN